MNTHTAPAPHTAELGGVTVSRFLVRDLDAIARAIAPADYVMNGQGVALIHNSIRQAFARQLMGGREFAPLREVAYAYVTASK